MSKKRIVVTGMSVISCVGNDPETFYQNLLAGKSGVSKISEFDCADFPTQIAGSVKDFDPGEYIDKKQARRVDRYISFAIVAGKKALEDAKLYPTGLETLNKARCGVLIGSGMGGMNTFSEQVQVLREKGHRKITPFLIPFIITNMGGALLAMDCGFLGPNYSISTACATSNYSIIQAAQHIRNNEADLIVCGGVEAPISPIGLGGFCACKALSSRNDDPERASRPWDKNRDGFVLGEGAGVLVLESLDHALKRGATIIAEYCGGGISCDAHHMTEPREDGEGVSLCLNRAFADAGIQAEDIDYINAHATSTSVGDLAEVRALLKVFKNPERISMNATKSMTGHSCGASGGIEAVATLKAIQTKMIHPTINLVDPEDVPFNLPTTRQSKDIRYAISNSFGFGGHNASVVFGAYQE